MDKDGRHRARLQRRELERHPGLRVTGKLAEDPVGTMTRPRRRSERLRGSAQLRPLGRLLQHEQRPERRLHVLVHGRISSDTGDFNWTTWIGSFNLCTATGGGGGGGGTDDFSIAASPSSITIVKGKSGNVTISTVLTSGSSQKVALSASGKPSGVSVSFTPTSVTPGGTPSASKMKITVGSKTSKGTYTLTVTGKGASATHTVPVVLTVKGTTLSKG